MQKTTGTLDVKLAYIGTPDMQAGAVAPIRIRN